MPNSHMAIDGQVCFHRWPFAVPVRPPRCTKGSVGPVNGINKDVSNANNCLVLWIESVSVTY